MIRVLSKVLIQDNSGVAWGKCIRVLGNKSSAALGDTIVIAVRGLTQRGKARGKIKKGQVFRALVIYTQSSFRGKDSRRTKLFKNSVLLLTSQNKSIGSRFLGPVPSTLRSTKFMRVALMGKGFL